MTFSLWQVPSRQVHPIFGTFILPGTSALVLNTPGSFCNVHKLTQFNLDMSEVKHLLQKQPWANTPMPKIKFAGPESPATREKWFICVNSCLKSNNFHNILNRLIRKTTQNIYKVYLLNLIYIFCFECAINAQFFIKKPWKTLCSSVQPQF